MTDIALAQLSQMTPDELTRLIKTPLPQYADLTVGDFVLDGPDAQGRYPWTAALALEVARQLADDKGLPIIAALNIVSYTGAIEHYASYSPASGLAADEKADTDFWAAIVGTRNTWGTEPRSGSSFGVTSFGPGEFWSTSHYHGTFDQMTADIKSRMIRDTIGHSDSDPARVFMVNVSAADRRLRKRAADLKIDLPAFA